MGKIFAITLGCVLFAIAVVDATSRRIPNALVLPAILGITIAACAWQPSALIGGVAWWLLFSAMHLRASAPSPRNSPRASAFGGGDAKLAFVTGVISSWNGFAGVFLGVGLTGAFAVLGHVWIRRGLLKARNLASVGPGSAETELVSGPNMGPRMVAHGLALPLAPAMILGAAVAFFALAPA